MVSCLRKLLFAFLCLASAQCFGVEPGVWWNPAESGRGFTIEIQGTTMAFAAYIYADDGRSTWLLSAGPMTDANNYSGQLYSSGGGQTLSGAYRKPTVTNANLGALTLKFSDATHGTLTWPGGTTAIEKFGFAAASSPGFRPQTGWWWNASESGRGFFIEVQGNTLVMAGYMYDDAGNPVWYTSAGTLTSPSLYQGDWLTKNGGQTLTGTYHPPGPAIKAGSGTVQFSSSTNATMTMPDGRQNPLTRFFFGGPTAPPPSANFAKQCAVPRAETVIDPGTGKPYGDQPGSLAQENAWVRSFVNETYLWYADVPLVDAALYVIGATVPYVYPRNNQATTVQLKTNYDVVDAYFNSQRSTEFTISGKPKDQFHFTYPTDQWNALALSGSEAGFGFEVALLAAVPPRKAVVAFTQPGSPATANGIARGAEFLAVNGVDVVSGSDVATLNEGLFGPVAGKSYTFTIRDLGASITRNVTMTATQITKSLVQNVMALPTPNNQVGYFLFTDHLATAERDLMAAVNQLKSENGGSGISDLVLDMRYNGGGYLGIASELAYMIAGPNATHDKIFEKETHNDKLRAQDDTFPFLDQTVGFSVKAGKLLPHLDLARVFVLTTAETCSASEAVINSLRGIGVQVIQIGGTTCGKPYGFIPQDNCSTTYFTIQVKGVNDAGFGDYADGFIPAGKDGLLNDLPGCVQNDDFKHGFGDPAEGLLAAALQYRSAGTCPPIAKQLSGAKKILVRSPARENRILFTPKRVN